MEPSTLISRLKKTADGMALRRVYNSHYVITLYFLTYLVREYVQRNFKHKLK